MNQKKQTIIDSGTVNKQLNLWRNDVFESDLTTGAKIVALSLIQYYNKKELTSYPSLNTICEMCSFGSRNTAIKSISELEQKEFITIERKRLYGNRFDSNIYSFVGVSGIKMSNTEQSKFEQSKYEPSTELSIELSNNEQEPNKPIKPIKPKKINKKENYILSIESNFQKPLREWLEYRSKLKEPKQWKFQYKKLKQLKRPIESVEYCIGQGYTGLFEIPDKEFKHINPKKSNKPSLREQLEAEGR